MHADRKSGAPADETGCADPPVWIIGQGTLPADFRCICFHSRLLIHSRPSACGRIYRIRYPSCNLCFHGSTLLIHHWISRQQKQNQSSQCPPGFRAFFDHAGGACKNGESSFFVSACMFISGFTEMKKDLRIAEGPYEKTWIMSLQSRGILCFAQESIIS